MTCRIAAFFLACSLANAQFAPLHTKLKPATEAAFQAYAKKIEASLEARWNGNAPFLSLDQNTAERNNVLNGNLIVEAGADPNPVPIADGLIHDWYGAVFIPHTNMARVLSVLQDFDHHSKIYPPILQSRLIKKSANDITGYWRLQQKGQMLPATFDVTQTAHYRQIGPGKWVCSSHADNIRAIEGDKVLSPGEGIGLMWKLYSYWTLEETKDGVLAECRTVSLSRSVPAGVAWMIRPFLNTVPRESMDSTLRNTRKAAAQ